MNEHDNKVDIQRAAAICHFDFDCFIMELWESAFMR